MQLSHLTPQILSAIKDALQTVEKDVNVPTRLTLPGDTQPYDYSFQGVSVSSNTLELYNLHGDEILVYIDWRLLSGGSSRRNKEAGTFYSSIAKPFRAAGFKVLPRPSSNQLGLIWAPSKSDRKKVELENALKYAIDEVQSNLRNSISKVAAKKTADLTPEEKVLLEALQSNNESLLLSLQRRLKDLQLDI